jgi:hypothetical protein
MAEVNVVVYSRTGSAECDALRGYLAGHGVDYRLRDVERDAVAKREWEELDGQVTPLMVIDQRQIVRGLDVARFEQLTGSIGC